MSLLSSLSYGAAVAAFVVILPLVLVVVFVLEWVSSILVKNFRFSFD
jgi:hypothetical protein